MAEERRRLIEVFAEIHAGSGGIWKLLPQDDWKPCMQEVLRGPVGRTVGY